MASNSSKYSAWAITLFAAAAYLIMRRDKQSNPQSLINYDKLYPETDMAQNELLPRGYRNNNPVNIRISSNKWAGKVSPKVLL